MITPTSKYSVTRDSLRAIPLPDRGTRSHLWQGIPHGELINAVLEQADSRNLVVKGEAWTLAKHGHNLFGRLDFETPPGLAMPAGTSLSLGLRHSNISEYAVTFAVGAIVTVCSNGLIAGEFVVKRRHTIGINLPQIIGQGLDRFLNVSRDIELMVRRLQASSINDFYASRAMVEAGRMSIMSWNLIDRVQQLWFEPIHDEFAPRTKWSLYNDFTEVLRDHSPAPAQMARIKAVGRLLTDNANINN